MASTGMIKPALVALNDGLAPHAAPLDCEDLRGPRSLFGESAPTPKPIGIFKPCGQGRLPAEYGNCRILWQGQDADGAADLALAARIITTGMVRVDGSDTLLPCPLDVPAVVYICGTCSSTFSVAWKLCADGLMPEWAGVICSRQTDGRGQLRRPWHSPRGNLYVTFRLPDDDLFKGNHASLLVGWILAAALRNLGFPLSLKWPNDMLLDERAKVGGVLIEERNGVLMAGLGLNLAEAPSRAEMRDQGSLPAAVLLPQHNINKKDFEFASLDDNEQMAPFLLWRRLVSELILEYNNTLAGQTFTRMLGRIDADLAWKNRAIILREGETVMARGRFWGLGQNGGMLVGMSSGERKELFSGSLFLA